GTAYGGHAAAFPYLLEGSCAGSSICRTYPCRQRMKRFATMEATMEQRAQERQLDLLMLTADDVTPRLFDLTTRAQIITLLKVLLSDRLALVSMPAETDDD